MMQRSSGRGGFRPPTFQQRAQLYALGFLKKFLCTTFFKAFIYLSNLIPTPNDFCQLTKHKNNTE